jgi:nucleoside-diphosphate-sugar epimerase
VDPSGRWVYALSKLAQESLVRRVAGPLRILRLGNVFGAGQERIVTTILRRLAGGRTVELENGVVRSLVSVQEVARIIVARLPPDLYNAGRPVRLTDLAELLMEESGMRCPIVETPRALVVHCGDLDASRLRALLPEAQTVENDLRVFAQEFDRLRPPAFDPPLPVVVPPRPENPYRLVARTVDALQ